jgi:glycosyltransferase involved in cell wall biosynthesis
MLSYYSNYINLHQVLVADELYKTLGESFRFVATMPRNEKELKGGDDYSVRPYCILAAESGSEHEEALRLAREAEVCVFGACSQEYAVERAKKNPQGLSFEMGERWLKHGWLTIGSPVFRQWVWNYYRYYRKANFYKLCCSSYTAGDDKRLHAYHGRHYKWGYFTNVEKKIVEASDADVSTKGKVHILWCARFLLLKHPELAVKLAERLKAEGYDVTIDMYGDEGHLALHDKPYPRKDLEALIEKTGTGDMVTLKGSRPNAEILQAMQEGDIFLFTSDRLEGWGAVANESMANGCVLVASDEIGSTAYLVKHEETGMVFKSCDVDSLYEQVKYLLDNPEERERISRAGRRQMVELWSPGNAARSLLQLIKDLQEGRETSIAEGPCSKA